VRGEVKIHPIHLTPINSHLTENDHGYQSRRLSGTARLAFTGTAGSLHSAWHEATKVFSARGLDNYLKGAAALKTLGKGDDLIATWIDHAPLVAKEIGEDVVPDLVQTALELASKTSGAVIELVLSTAPRQPTASATSFCFATTCNSSYPAVPGAARRAPDAGKSGKTVQPAHTGRLAPLGIVGRTCPPHQLPEQGNYFSLQSKESLAMLQKERKGTLFIDVQRRINMYLRALWARDFFMKPTSGDFETREGYRPYVEVISCTCPTPMTITA